MVKKALCCVAGTSERHNARSVVDLSHGRDKKAVAIDRQQNHVFSCSNLASRTYKQTDEAIQDALTVPTVFFRVACVLRTG